MENLEKIVEELKRIREKHNLVFNDGDLIVLAGKIFISNNINEEKKKPSTKKPTEKQVAFFKEHNVKVPETKDEATKLIREYIKNQSNL